MPFVVRLQVQLGMPAHELLTRFEAREIEFILKKPQDDLDRSAAASSIPVEKNAFAALREGSRRAFGNEGMPGSTMASLPHASHIIDNAKTQLEADVHEILDALGMQSPVSQHPMLRKVLKDTVNYCWYLDPHHARMAHLGGARLRFPREFSHLCDITYNRFKEKKVKTPRLKAEELEVYVNELFINLTAPVLRLPCNARVLSVLTELAHVAAMQLSAMRGHAAFNSQYSKATPIMTLNDGDVVITYHPKVPGPYLQDVEKKLIHELRSKVRFSLSCPYAVPLTR